MEYIHKRACDAPVRAVLFDFDGTISTLRYGWEETMRPLMLETISGTSGPYSDELCREVDAYIDESTGIQTIYQMKWLAERAARERPNAGLSSDPWHYKAEYNRRLMQTVEKRLDALNSGKIPRENYLISGSAEFLRRLKEKGIRVYVASGTDDPDVKRESAALGVSQYFDAINGAPVGLEACSKEKVMRDLIECEKLQGENVAVFGDGKVEIALGASYGARTVGMATNEADRRGVNEIKRNRLIKAGADVLTGDFTETKELLAFLGL